jgi:hypothetical protein
VIGQILGVYSTDSSGSNEAKVQFSVHVCLV